MADKRPTVVPFEYDISKNTLLVLDQRELPHKVTFTAIKNCDDGAEAIRNMSVRGAPCIAAVACLTLVVDANATIDKLSSLSPNEFKSWFQQKANTLKNARPTAVNVVLAFDRLAQFVDTNQGDIVKETVASLTEFVWQALRGSLQRNKDLGQFGSHEIIMNTEDNRKDKLNLLTHCNTGFLATVGYGTALGVVRSLHSNGGLEMVYFTETRPYNQGSRLTAWELIQDEIPSKLIADSAVASLMASHQIDAVVVGADRVMQSGHTTNKIGTLQIAIVSKHFNIPFYVAAPTTTIDSEPSAKPCVIEERSADELLKIKDLQVGPVETKVWNPGFDTTPPELITSIITEVGICKPTEVERFMSIHKESGVDAQDFYF